jgi:tRNA G18 (ribose-2'-O)-methylase SpoU
MGLNKAYKTLCDNLFTIPMVENANAFSFNVNCAA